MFSSHLHKSQNIEVLGVLLDIRENYIFTKLGIGILLYSKLVELYIRINNLKMNYSYYFGSFFEKMLFYFIEPCRKIKQYSVLEVVKYIYYLNNVLQYILKTIMFIQRL